MAKKSYLDHDPTAETRRKVQSYAAVGIPKDDISKIIGIDKKTLYKYYRKELDVSAMEANAAVGGALYRNAMEGNVTAQIFWAKTRMRWKEAKEEEPEQKPQPINITFSESRDANK